MNKVTPFLWFDADLNQVTDFYKSVFQNVSADKVMKFGSGEPGDIGYAETANFEIEGQKFMAINGGSTFKFTEAVSFFVLCEDQEEIDDLWAKLTAGGQESECGWLKDKYGLSWQIVPKGFDELMAGQDREGAERAMQAMLKMKKLDINELRRAYEG